MDGGIILPADVIAHVGSFMDINARLNCVASSTALASINYGLTQHEVRVRPAGPDLRTHLPFIKRIKPSCTELWVRFDGLDAEPEEATLDCISAASSFANSAFSSGTHAVFSKCSADAVQRALPAFGRWQLSELHVSLRKQDAFTPGLVAVLLALIRGGCVMDLSLVLWNEQADVLSNAELARAVRSSVNIVVDAPCSLPVNLEQVGHVRSLALTMSKPVAVRAPQNLTFLNTFFSPDEDGGHNPLLESFRARSRMERVIMGDMSGDSGRGCVDLLVALKGLLPATCEFYYYGGTCNVYLVHTLRMMREVHASIGVAYYAGDDEFLVSRAIQLLLPGIPCICPKRVEEAPAELKALGTLADVHSRMSPEVQRTWFWLPLVANTICQSLEGGGLT